MTPSETSQKYRDLASRAAWTALQAVLSIITVEAFDIPMFFVPIIATALSFVKSYVAGKVGDPTTVTFR